MNLNKLSEKLLNRLRNFSPEIDAIDLIEVILSLVGTMPIELTIDHRLSEQEAECLYWLINGATQSQIAKLMDISRETVKGYQTRILRKLDGRTMTQAVYKKALSFCLKKQKLENCE